MSRTAGSLVEKKLLERLEMKEGEGYTYTWLLQEDDEESSFSDDDDDDVDEDDDCSL